MEPITISELGQIFTACISPSPIGRKNLIAPAAESERCTEAVEEGTLMQFLRRCLLCLLATQMQRPREPEAIVSRIPSNPSIKSINARTSRSSQPSMHASSSSQNNRPAPLPFRGSVVVTLLDFTYYVPRVSSVQQVHLCSIASTQKQRRNGASDRRITSLLSLASSYPTSWNETSMAQARGGWRQGWLAAAKSGQGGLVVACPELAAAARWGR